MEETLKTKKLPELPKTVTEGYDPGSFGFHEIVDRSCLVAELFADSISEHPAAKHPKLAKKVERIEKALFDLYQTAACLHV